MAFFWRRLFALLSTLPSLLGLSLLHLLLVPQFSRFPRCQLRVVVGLAHGVCPGILHALWLARLLGELGLWESPPNLGERRGDMAGAESGVLAGTESGFSTRECATVGVPIQVPVAPRFTGGVFDLYLGGMSNKS